MNKREAQILSDKVIKRFIAIKHERKITNYMIYRDTGISQSSLSSIDKLEQKPSLYLVFMIAEYLNIDLAEIIKEVRSEN